MYVVELIGIAFLALRGVGPECEAESLRFHWRRVTKVGPGVKHGFLGLRGRARKFSITDPQQVLPLAKVALEAHALRNLKSGDDAAAQSAFPLLPERWQAEITLARGKALFMHVRQQSSDLRGKIP
jgi:hypothetical protein